MAETARSAEAITPSDATAQSFDAIQVGGAGVVTFKDRDGTSVAMTVPAGGYVLCQTSYVMATGTTATLLVGLRY
jgi:hypothetical protein